MQVKVEQLKEGGVPCGCGRSPNGFCIGWHGLSQEQYEIELSKYREKIFDEKPREE